MHFKTGLQLQIWSSTSKQGKYIFRVWNCAFIDTIYQTLYDKSKYKCVNVWNRKFYIEVDKYEKKNHKTLNTILGILICPT